MARKTKEPKKLHVERDGHKFKCSWKCGEEYDQGVQFRYSLGKWKKGPLPVGGIAYTTPFGDNGWLAVSKVYDLSKKADHKTVTGVDFSDYYPTTKVYLVGFSFSVRGNRKKHKEKEKNVDPEWSDWVNYGMFTIKNPPQMKMGTPQYEGAYYSSFSYGTPNETQHIPIIDYEWQACLTKGGESPNWNNPDKTGVRKKSAASTFYIVEDKYKGRDIDWTEPNYSYTRHVRIRARGPGGPGAWSKVVNHVYTMAKPSTGVSARLIKNANQAGYLCQITWTAAADKTRPNDGNLAYYTFAVPTENMGCPYDATWEEVPGGMIKDTKDKDSYSFIISNRPPSDHVMFVKIDTTHDAETTPGYPIFVKGSNIYPSLTPPVIGSVVPNVENYKVSLSGIQNPSEVSGSFIGVHFRDGNDSGDGKLVGVITDTSVPTPIQCPNWSEKGFALGLQTIAGAIAIPSTDNDIIEKTDTLGIELEQGSVSFDTTSQPIETTTITVRYSIKRSGEAWDFWNKVFPLQRKAMFTAGTSRTQQLDDGLIMTYNKNSNTFTATIDPSISNMAPYVIESIIYRCLPDEYESDLLYYDLTPNNDTVKIMKSDIAWSGDIPLPPSNLKVTQDGVNTILATWDWNWKEANTAEISWANHEDAWESTDEPQTYTIDNVKASRWKIANLEPGNWYVKVRLIKNSDDASVYGTYATADKFPIKVSSAPSTPSLMLLPDTITVDGSTTASWAYEAEDGTTQSEAEVYEAIPDGNGGYSYVSLDPPAKATSAQFITINAETQGWKEGETHDLSVRVMSTVGELSEDYSPPKTVAIVAKPTVKIESTSLVSRTIVVDSGTEEDDTETTETVPNVLAYLPLEVTVTGAGEGGTTYLSIIRDGPYHGERPDGTNIDGFDGEIIASASHDGDGLFRIEKADRSGYFDDGASYKIHAMVKDSHGQVAETEEIMSIYTLTTDTEVNEDTEYYSYDSQTETYTKVDPEDGDNPSQQGWYTNRTYNSFIVVWDHQAVMPEADVEVDNDEDVVFITPRFYVLTTDTTVVSGTDYFSYDEDDGYVKVEPESGDNPYSEGWYVHGEPVSGDTCDIYRLSADKPELIVTNGEFNTKYVDPYPTYGQFGGHRIVYITKEGDYTAGEIEAIKDFREEEGDIIDNRKVENFKTVIDFNNEKVELPYDLSVSLKWAKDVAVNKYLDGSVTADWNPAVDLTTTINTTAYVIEEPEMMLGLRRLAMWPGYCHVRTPDGSSFTADVQVNIDHEEKLINRLAKVSLSITRVDNYRHDGMTYEEWIASREPGE